MNFGSNIFSDDEENESELEYQRQVQADRAEYRQELKSIYSRYIHWRANFPHELDIWKGDSRNKEISNEFSPELEDWSKWKMTREKEDRLIEESKAQLKIVKKLIDIDAISWGFNQFIGDKKIDSLIKLINKWKEDNPNFIDEYNSLDIGEWPEYNFFQQRAVEEYKKIMLRCLRFPNSVEKECFLGKNITREDLQQFIEMRQRNILNKIPYDYIFNLGDIRKLELWVKSNHFLEWDNWARSNTNWDRYVRNGYAYMYQEVWWKRHESEKKYWECEDNAIPEGYNYNPEFKRRLTINKLKHLHHSKG
ncbi:hypothetical protein [Sphingobacterium mizutaii]|uniref:hypothetical protein n=1 Tax=Sphingobacterium mizutaii TaxID=1010 RepID=UPI0016240072|nr:hypothetical protein [Sphingobacterium mizutaii]